MRYGVIADVHANLPALDTVIGFLHDAGVDRIVCLGDLVGYGPQPNEVIERIASLDIPCVVGNHDLVAIGSDELDRCGSASRESLAWTRAELSHESRSYLAALPPRLELEGGVLAVHGSIDDPWTYVRRAPDAYSQIHRMRREGDSTLLMLGHTHRQMAIDATSGSIATANWVGARRTRRLQLTGSAFLNPGAVGQSREPRALARCALVDLEERAILLVALRYPDERCKAELRDRGLPPEWCHPRPTAKKVVRQVLRDAKDRRYRPPSSDRGAEVR